MKKSIKERISNPTSTYSSLSTATFAPITAQPLPRSSQVATAAPKRVIRAQSGYQAQNSNQLSFVEGDFFHVVGEGSDEYFEAANPMTGVRGLVPTSHFQVLGRNVRETATVAVKTKGHQQQSSYQPSVASNSTSPQLNNNGHSSNNSSSSTQVRKSQPSPATPKSQPLYGIVQYDFVAERADELDAKRGEPIIVIAQSNHEWFVAKPIGRLGGPGLIPVAFVEIQDMTTGKPVENVEELIRSAVVPQVEEWKKMTADYKSASIPLGRFDFSQNNAPAVNTRNGSQSGAAGGRPPIPVSPVLTQGGRLIPSQYDNNNNNNNNFSANSPALSSHSLAPNSPNSLNSYEARNDARYSYSRERARYGLVTAASVESFHQEEGSFWFHLRAFFSTGASLVLYRLYQDFYDFQIALMDEFPIEAGRLPPGEEGKGYAAPERILPMMPGPTDYEDEVVCAQRVHDLSIYLTDLCALPDQLRMSGLMYEFLVPRAGDVEVAVGNGRGDLDTKESSIEGQYGELVEYLDSMDGQEPNSPILSNSNNGRNDLEERMGGMSVNGNSNDRYDNQNQPGSANTYSTTSNPYSPNADDRYKSQGSYQATYPSNSSSSTQAPMGNANQNVPFVKIKIFHRNTDDLIAIRVPPTVSHVALLEKVRERLGNDVVNLRYREEVGSSGPVPGSQVVMAGGARLISVNNDESLERWIRSNQRLVLYAD